MLKAISFTLLTSMLIVFTGCLGEHKNITSSYAIGTVLTNEAGKKFILLDNTKIAISSNDLQTWEIINEQRVFTGYTINFDEQPTYGNDNIYTATINATPFDNDYTIPQEGIVYESDTVIRFYSPYIAYRTNDKLLTIQTEVFADKAGSTNKNSFRLVQPRPYVQGSENKVDTLLLIYHQGDIDKTSAVYKFQSFTLPQYPEDVKLVIKFRADNASFTPGYVNQAQRKDPYCEVKYLIDPSKQ